MEFLTSPKSEYLLEANTKVLHAESHEWLEEIEFMQDEAVFFESLMGHFPVKLLEQKQKDEYERLKSRGKTYWHKVLDEFRLVILSHEKYLADILKENIYADVAEYRRKHNGIKHGYLEICETFRKYKKELFQWVKDLE